MSWITVSDYSHPGGWSGGVDPGARARRCCEQVEAGRVLFFPEMPFDFPPADRELLLGLRREESQYHKNISYRPQQDVLRGFSSDRPGEVQELHRIMRHFSRQVTGLLTQVLAPYAPHWSLDFASFRPLEEKGRDLPLHKRNDLLHVDAFPTRPTHGGRILRAFANINPAEPRIWHTGEHFPELARRYACDAGLARFVAGADSPIRGLSRGVAALKRAVGLRGIDRSPYDAFMLRFHDWLKENRDFQENRPKMRMEFPPNSFWVVFTDAVPHAALSGQYALEQTTIVPVDALLAPERAPVRVLETLCGRPLANGH